MKRSRRTFSASFKSKVVLEALKEQSTLQELSSKYKIHAQQITTWKSEFLENASSIFENKSAKDKTASEEEQLYNKISHIQVQIDFLKKVLGK
ncbi:transposase [Flavobacteriales bacterium]|nr:transposase [Flavobacteriales bacterium]